MAIVKVHEILVVSAVKYAVQNDTYIAGLTIDEVSKIWEQLSPGSKKSIQETVEEKIANKTTPSNILNEWKTFHQFILKKKE